MPSRQALFSHFFVIVRLALFHLS